MVFSRIIISFFGVFDLKINRKRFFILRKYPSNLNQVMLAQETETLKESFGFAGALFFGEWFIAL